MEHKINNNLKTPSARELKEQRLRYLLKEFEEICELDDDECEQIDRELNLD